MKIKVTLTAHARDTVLTVTSLAAAAAVIEAFAAGVGRPGQFSRQTMIERKAQKVDYLMQNAGWYAEVVG